jgi:hypothetical protein
MGSATYCKVAEAIGCIINRDERRPSSADSAGRCRPKRVLVNLIGEEPRSLEPPAGP